jgi:hypothetical protein
LSLKIAIFFLENNTVLLLVIVGGFVFVQIRRAEGICCLNLLLWLGRGMCRVQIVFLICRLGEILIRRSGRLHVATS